VDIDIWMHDATDMELLRQYVDRNSDTAFAALISRHVNLVYSAALRKTGNPHAAEEITQAVFIILAQKAGRISKKTILPGWLYQTTRLTAASFWRRETRRVRREQEAYMQTELHSTAPDETWEQLAPLLEDAMGQLGERDRAAVVLRFFGGKSFDEVAAASGISENAAKKRVNHALEKLQRYFSKRGVRSTTAIVAVAISANSVHAAPTALAKSVTVAAMTKGAMASGSTLTLIKGALKLMAWSQAKTAIVIGAGVLLAAGTTTVTVKEIQEHKTYSWEVPQASFGIFYKTAAQMEIVPSKFNTTGGWVCDEGRGAMGIAVPVEDIVHVAYQKDKLRTVIATEMPPGRYDFFAKLADDAISNAGWATALQEEITRKFDVTGRLEEREADVFILKPGSAGTRGFTVSHSMPNGRAIIPESGGYSYFEQPVTTLTHLLEHRFDIPIIDRTGLTNTYDFTLNWNEPDEKQPNLEGLKQALLDQLGLELVPNREPIEMLVVEKAK
jgi:uncharacterized protein (TIGR03435 family)